MTDGFRLARSRDAAHCAETIPPRSSIVARGVIHGFLAGAVCGVLAIGAVQLTDPSARPGTVPGVMALALIAGGFGSFVGLVVGAVGGVAFALAAPCLAGHQVITRLAGAAVVPGLLLLGWIAAWAFGGHPILPDAQDVRRLAPPLVFLGGTGGGAGALVARRVMHGSRREPVRSGEGTPGPPGGEGADSSA